MNDAGPIDWRQLHLFAIGGLSAECSIAPKSMGQALRVLASLRADIVALQKAHWSEGSPVSLPEIYYRELEIGRARIDLTIRRLLEQGA